MRTTFLVIALPLLVNSLIAQTPELKINAGHGSSIASYEFSPDQKLIVSAGGFGVIKLWNVSLGKEIRTFTGNIGMAHSVCFSPDGRYVAGGGSEKTIVIWDVISGNVLKTISTVMSPDALSYTPDGKYIVSADLHISIWDVKTGEKNRGISSDGATNTLCISPDGKTIAGNLDNKIVIWDIKSGALLAKLSGKLSGYKPSVRFSADGKYIVASSSTEVKLWDVQTRKSIYKFKGPKIYLPRADISPDSKHLAIACDYSLVKVDVNLKKEVKRVKIRTNNIGCVRFSFDGKTVTAQIGNSISFWDFNSLNQTKVLTGQCSRTTSAAFTPDGKGFVCSNSSSVVLWDINSAKVKRIYERNSKTATAVSVSPDGKLTACAGDVIRVYKSDNQQLLRTFTGIPKEIYSLRFSPDGKILMSVSRGRKETVVLWEVSTGNKIQVLNEGNIHWRACGMFSPNGKQIAYLLKDKIKIRDTYSGRIVRSIAEMNSQTMAFSPDGKFMASGDVGGDIKTWDISAGRKVSTSIELDGMIHDIDFSPDGKFILTASGDGLISLWEFAHGWVSKPLKSLPGHVGAAWFASFSPDGKQILSSGTDCITKIWNIGTDNWVAFVNSVDADKEIAFTPDNYWDGSPNCGDLVSMVKGLDYWNIDQFAVKNNRPDIILQQLESKDANLIAHYYSQYQKRLRRLALSEEQLSKDYHVPTAEITESKKSDKFLDLRANISDLKFNLKRYNIFVNDVPLFGSYGKEVTGKSVDIAEHIELGAGDNKIEVSCMNEKGAEAYRALAHASYDKPVKGDLYCLGFGVSKYKNTELDLQYADKDAEDIAGVFEKSKGKTFTNTFTKTLTNEEVTPESIIAAKDFVKNAKPDDTFVLFIAGHGVHDQDEEATYYYLTHNADPDDLKNTAADFETIEELLQGIAPRNKLFLMDACESGEIDEGEQTKFVAMAGSRGLRSRGLKKVESKAATNSQPTPSAMPRSYLYEKDRYIYNDLARRSGAIVFSSSKGGEFSFERSDIENGLFTESIIKALTSKNADKDGDGTISTDELREYVSADVAKTSNDLQHPTVDRDNIYQKFGFAVVK